jgi:hypothetical protein
MTGTIARTRTKPRPKALAPMIREVCLVGSSRRAYVHIAPKGLRTQDTGLKKTRTTGAG